MFGFCLPLDVWWLSWWLVPGVAVIFFFYEVLGPVHRHQMSSTRAPETQCTFPRPCRLVQNQRPSSHSLLNIHVQKAAVCFQSDGVSYAALLGALLRDLRYWYIFFNSASDVNNARGRLFRWDEAVHLSSSAKRYQDILFPSWTNGRSGCSLLSKARSRWIISREQNRINTVHSGS